MWHRKITNEGEFLLKSIDFKDFNEAWMFMEVIAQLAKNKNHHPTLCNTYNSVTIQLTTHDANNKITSKDVEMSEQIDLKLNEFFG